MNDCTRQKRLAAIELILRPGRWLNFPLTYLDLLTANEALLLADLQNEQERQDKEYFVCTDDRLGKRLYFAPSTAVKLFKTLKAKSLIATKRFGYDPKRYVTIQKEAVAELLSLAGLEDPTTRNSLIRCQLPLSFLHFLPPTAAIMLAVLIDEDIRITLSLQRQGEALRNRGRSDKAEQLEVYKEWQHHTVDSLCHRTGFEKRTQTRLMDTLVTQGLISVKHRGVPPIRYTRLNWLQIESCVCKTLDSKGDTLRPS